jgi:hypothetical protein
MSDNKMYCVYAVADCRAEDGPVVSEDCGINDRVVRAWAQSRWRNAADPVSAPEPVLVGICEHTDHDDE